MTKPPAAFADCLQGIDVSKFQGRIDWRRLFREAGPGTEENIHFVSIRCGESNYATPDDEWERNFKGAHDAGFEFIDSYHVFHPIPDPLIQANIFIERLDRVGRLGSYDSISNDFEVREGQPTAFTLSRSILFTEAVEFGTLRECKVYTGMGFLDALTSASTGHRTSLAEPSLSPSAPLLDPGPSSSDAATAARKEKRGIVRPARPLWVAHYGVQRPTVPKAWQHIGWMWWQYIGDAADGLPGIPAKAVDRDVFFSDDVSELRRYFQSAHLFGEPYTREIAPGSG